MKNTKNKTNKAFLGIILILGFNFLLNIAQASEITKDKVIELVNKDRLQQGIGRLVENADLARAANEKAADMIANKYFAHTSPVGTNPWFWFEKNNYDYKFAGENLAIDFKSAEKQETAWMNSEKHRKNILNPNYQEIGIAVKEGEVNGYKSVVTVQLFGARDGFVPPVEKEKKIEMAAEKSNVLGAENRQPVVSSPDYSSSVKNTMNAMRLDIYQVTSVALLVAFAYAGLVFLSFRKHNAERVDVKKLYTLDPQNYLSYLDVSELSLNDHEQLQPVYVASRRK